MASPFPLKDSMSKCRVKKLLRVCLAKRAGLPTQPVCPGGCGGLQTVEQPFGSQEPEWRCPVCGSPPQILAVVRHPPDSVEGWQSPEAVRLYGFTYCQRMIERLRGKA
jgi:hypothetical protein